MITIRQVREMAELYRAGWSQDWIAERLGVAQSTVHYHLSKQRVRRRPPNGNAGRLSHREMDRTCAYTRPSDHYEIAQVMGRDHSSISERLQRAGVPLRSRSEAARLAWGREHRHATQEKTS